jgi:hypothetical protein
VVNDDSTVVVHSPLQHEVKGSSPGIANDTAGENMVKKGDTTLSIMTLNIMTSIMIINKMRNLA